MRGGWRCVFLHLNLAHGHTEPLKGIPALSPHTREVPRSPDALVTERHELVVKEADSDLLGGGVQAVCGGGELWE